MKNKRSVSGLIESSAGRTGAARDQVMSAMTELRKQFETGQLIARLATQNEKQVKERHVLQLTTLGPNFLNGKIHKKTTKIEVQRFLAELNKDLASTESDVPSGGDADDWKARYARLATRAHGWKTSMIILARENREMKKKLGLKVVPIQIK
jgi:hypothetical protein